MNRTHSPCPLLSLVPPQPQVDTEFAPSHHCAFWAAGAVGQDLSRDNNLRR
jgi:hypothetical protein